LDAKIDKRTVRRIAQVLGLDDIAELPASPCLASRIETHLTIEPSLLQAIDAAETLIQEKIQGTSIRCRLRRDAIVVEVDAHIFEQMDTENQTYIRRIASSLLGPLHHMRPVKIEAYVQGSAFLQKIAP
jgi:uncharacterized protein